MSGFAGTAQVADATAVRIRAATDSGLTTDVVVSGEETPDGDGYFQCDVTGLPSFVDAWCRLENQDSGGTWHNGSIVGPFKTRPTPGDPTSFAFAFGSCVQPETPNDQAFEHIDARNPDLFFFLGDWGYPDSGSTSQATHRGNLENIYEAFPALAQLVSKVPTYRLLSDHDGTDGNNGGPGSWTTAIRNAHKQFFPTPALSNSNGLYYSFVYGRVKFIVTDSRFLSTSTSMFGSTQQDWFINELTTDEPLKIWVQDTPWTDNDPGTPGEDKWADKGTNQQDVADLIEANAVGRVITISGDLHAVAADDGSNDPTGLGLVNLVAAPFHQDTENEAGPWSEGIWPSSGSSLEQQYGWVEITDDGSSITLDFTGYDSDDVARVTYSVEVDTSETLTAAGDVGLSIGVAASARKLAGSAGSVGLGLAAADDATKTGTADAAVGVAVDPGATDAKSGQTSGSTGLALGVAGVDAKTGTATGAVPLTIDPTGAGSKTAGAAAVLGLGVDLTGTGQKSTTATAALGLALALAGAAQAIVEGEVHGSVGLSLDVTGTATKRVGSSASIGLGLATADDAAKHAEAEATMALALAILGAASSSAGGASSGTLGLLVVPVAVATKTAAATAHIGLGLGVDALTAKQAAAQAMLTLAIAVAGRTGPEVIRDITTVAELLPSTWHAELVPSSWQAEVVHG